MNTKIYQIEKEAIESHIKALLAAKEVLEKFDGKVINKKLMKRYLPLIWKE